MAPDRSPTDGCMQRVTLYSLSTCPACRKVKEFLDGHHVLYTLIEVDTLDGSEQWTVSRELAKHNPRGSYPTLVIEEIVIGYDPDSMAARFGALTREGQ